MPKKWFRFWEGKPSYNFPDEWEQVLQSQQEVNTAAAKATAEEDSSHPFDENSDNDTLNAETFFNDKNQFVAQANYLKVRYHFRIRRQV